AQLRRRPDGAARPARAQSSAARRQGLARAGRAAAGRPRVKPRAKIDHERTSFIGMAVFLGGWTMLFVALLFVWADVRLSSPTWPPDGEPRAPLLYPAIATVLIAASSWMLARGRVAATVLLGGGFVAVQLAGLAALWRAGVTPSSGRYG